MSAIKKSRTPLQRRSGSDWSFPGGIDYLDHTSHGREKQSQLDEKEASTSAEAAVAAMVSAGAVFALHDCSDLLGERFTYTVTDSGDRDKCRAILTNARHRPAPFFAAFRAEIQAQVRGST